MTWELTDDALLIHSDSYDGDTTFVDSSENEATITINGGTPHHSTTQQKFGATSIYFDGSEDAVKIPDTFYNLPTNSSFTLDFWVYFTDNSRAYVICGNGGSYSPINGWTIMRYTDRKIYFCYGAANTGYSAATSTATVQDTTWTHVAFVKDAGGVIRIAINGVFGQNNASKTWRWDARSSQTTEIGENYLDYSLDFKGFIDEFRIRYDAAWTEDFTPLTEVYGSSSVSFVFETEAEEPPAGDGVHFNFDSTSSSNEGQILFDLPIITIECSGENYDVPYNNVNIDLPVKTLEFEGNAWDGDIGDTYGDIEFSLPIFEYVSYIQQAGMEFDIPLLEVEITTLAEPISGDIELDLPVISVEFANIDPISSTLVATIPILEFDLEGDNRRTDFLFSLPEKVFTGYSGARISTTFPKLTMTATGENAAYCTISLSLPVFECTVISNWESSVFTLPIFDVDISASTSNSSVFVGTLPILGMVAEAFIENQADILFEIPVLECELFQGCFFEIETPMLSCEINAETPAIVSMEFSLKQKIFIGTAISRTPTNLAFNLPVMSTLMSSQGSKYNTCNFELPTLKATLHAINNGVSELEINIPLLYSLLHGYHRRLEGDYLEIYLPMISMLNTTTDTESESVWVHVREAIR